jgi:hypothetical protein
MTAGVACAMPRTSSGARGLCAGARATHSLQRTSCARAARARSSLYWTPVEVAVRAANLLANRAGARIVDIGSGVGKFCIVAAAAVNANVRGIEHRRHFVDIACEAAAKIGVTVSLDGGTIEELDAEAIDGFYLFNQFAENLCSAAERLDGTVELRRDRFCGDVDATEHLLSKARVGARVVTYCGFGGDMPDDFQLVSSERTRGGNLEVWVKLNEAPWRSTSGRQSVVRQSAALHQGARGARQPFPDRRQDLRPPADANRAISTRS